jgi:uncharacterized protein (TIGR02646 family)
MLFIQKTFPPQSLIDFNHRLRTAVSNPVYTNSPQSLSVDTAVFQELKRFLESEQKGLCCYCMKRVTAKNSIVEHFLSQSMFPEYQTDYYNLYLACCYSVGKAKENQHCDVRKSDELIVKLMSFRRASGKLCQDLFQYSENDGSILPAEDIAEDLKQILKEVNLVIETLNLNAIELKEERRKFIENIKPIIQNANKTKLQSMKTEYETKLNQKFAGVAIYLINEKLKKS